VENSIGFVEARTIQSINHILELSQTGAIVSQYYSIPKSEYDLLLRKYKINVIASNL
jgi:hypothetical protein